jgi:hypothetical protein
LTVKKISGPGSAPVAGPEEPGQKPARRVGSSFAQSLGQAARGQGAEGGLEAVVLEAAQAVRRGDLDPDQALESILSTTRQVLARDLPPEVDMEDVLQYIKETLESDPTFLALLTGSAPTEA